jgi:hypothetical protein
MDAFRSTSWNLEHRHADGSWSRLEPVREAHDPAETDPERSWTSAVRLFICRSCDEEVRIRTDEPDAEAPR